MPARTCSSGGAGSWMTAPATWPAGVEGRSDRLIGPDLGNAGWPSRQGSRLPLQCAQCKGPRPLRTPDRAALPKLPIARVMRRSGEASDHNGEGFALCEERVVDLKSMSPVDVTPF